MRSTRGWACMLAGALIAAGCSSDESDRWVPRAPTRVIYGIEKPIGEPTLDLYIARADGSGRKGFMNSPGEESDPRWSPDGRWILFREAAGREEAPDIVLARPDGSAKRNLTHTPKGTEWSPAWSPDGQTIVYSSDSPDPSAFAMGLYAMNRDGSRKRPLADDPALSEEHPWFSPDGTRIVYLAYASEGNIDVYVVGADGSDRHRLTDEPGYDTWPTWSPDGKLITFTSDRDGDEDIWAMNPDGSDPVNLTRTGEAVNESFPSWTPDGRISYMRGSGSTYELWLMDANGENQRRFLSKANGIAVWTAAR